MGSAQGSADHELVRRVLAGDPEAGRAYARRMLCVPRILAVQNRRLGHPLDDHELEDLSQEVLIVVWDKLREYEGIAGLETWAYRFCYHLLMNAVRKHGRRDARVSALGEADADVADHRAHAERFQDLYAGIERLPRAEREVVEERMAGERTFEEIGHDAGEPATTVKSRYYKALDRLSQFLGRSAAPGEPDGEGERHG